MNDAVPVRRLTETPVVAVEKLTIAQPEGRVLLHEAGFSLAAGEVVILAGPSGSGKSTLVNLLSGAIDAGDEGWRIAGHVHYAGTRIDLDRKSTRLNSSHYCASRMPSSA